MCKVTMVLRGSSDRDAVVAVEPHSIVLCTSRAVQGGPSIALSICMSASVELSCSH